MPLAAQKKASWFDLAMPVVVGAGLLYVFFDDLIRLAVGIVFIFGPCFAYSRLKNRIADRFPASERWLWVGFPALLVAGWFMKDAFYDVFGTARPGALFEKGSYEARLFVHAYPEGSATKNYRVPALIRACYEDFDDGERTHSQRVYRIEYFDFPGGGRVTFADSDEALSLRERVGIFDDQM